MSIFMLSLFLISAIPFALAEEGRVEATATGELKPLSSRTEIRTEIKTENDERKGDSKERIIERRKETQDKREEFKEKRREEFRDIKKEMRQDLRLKIEEKRKNFLEGKKELRLEFRDRLKSCKGDETENCKTTRGEAKVDAQANLLHAIDRILIHIDKIQERIEDSRMSMKTELLTALETDEKKILALQTNVEALGENVTAEELRTYSKELKDLWKNIHQNLRISISVGANFGVHGVLVRAEKLETRLDTVLKELKEQGEDVTTAEKTTASFKTHIEKAKNLSGQADAKFKLALKSSEEKEALVKEGHDLLKQAREELAMAHKDLKIAVKLIKQLKNGATKLAEKTATVEAEVQAELNPSTPVVELTL